MKKDQVQIGGTYVAKVSGKMTVVRLDGESPYGGWNATNVATKRKLRIKSAQRLRYAAKDRNNPNAAPASPPQDSSYDPDRCPCGKRAAMTVIGEPTCHECWTRICEAEDAKQPAATEVAEVDETPEDACPEGQPESDDTSTEKEIDMSTTKTKKTKTTKKTKSTDGAKKEKRTSALDAAATVLKKKGAAMHCPDLITAMADQGLWTSPGGKTPHATLYSAIMREINTKGKDARFAKVERGKFEFNKAVH